MSNGTCSIILKQGPNIWLVFLPRKFSGLTCLQLNLWLPVDRKLGTQWKGVEVGTQDKTGDDNGDHHDELRALYVRMQLPILARACGIPLKWCFSPVSPVLARTFHDLHKTCSERAFPSLFQGVHKTSMVCTNPGMKNFVMSHQIFHRLSEGVFEY